MLFYFIFNSLFYFIDWINELDELEMDINTNTETTKQKEKPTKQKETRTQTQQTPVCKYFLAGSCLVVNCPFKHTDQVLCKFFLSGFCGYVYLLIC
jgi:hypothetical protein